MGIFITHHFYFHYTGNYRGAAQLECILRGKKSFYIPVIAYNFLGYDSHLIIVKIAKKSKNCNLLCIRKYWIIYFLSLKGEFKKENKGKEYKKSCSLRFIDSARFMKASLDSLVYNLLNKNISRKCRHYKNCKECKEYHEYNNDSVDWCNEMKAKK